ncbi:helix-turn-helix transcriptional regulator [Phenylobacterium sp.]|uniref:ArsR/SmtB family transcription factor n=1 Tax=Phenylobacterium sp. TaxID=1871053 RepID=UPI0025F1029C|nr:metalloregulator ArsR/SmtB family transcription factor [Phenylobacterium sp.]
MTRTTSPDVFRALAEPVRRRLLERLVARPASAGELSRRLGIPRVNVSHHLGVLAAAGLVELRQRQAAVRPAALLPVRRYFDEALARAAITLSESANPVAPQARR